MPAEEAAQDRAVECYLRWVEPRQLGNVGLELLGRLIGQPDFQTAIRIEPGQGGWRLQLRVMQILALVGCRDNGLGSIERFGNVADILRLLAAARLVGELVAESSGGEIRGHMAEGGIGVRAGLAPIDLSRLGRALGIPPAFSDNSDRTGQTMDGMNARHCLELLFVADLADCQAEARRMLDGGMQHAVDLAVYRIDRLAG